MPSDVMTNPAVAERLQEMIESLGAHAGSPNATKFSEGLASIVRVLTQENLRLNEVLRNETLVPPRQPLSVTAVTRADAAYVIALDHLGGFWQHRVGSDFWEALPRLPTPPEAEEQSRKRHEAEMARHRAAQERGYR